MSSTQGKGATMDTGGLLTMNSGEMRELLGVSTASYLPGQSVVQDVQMNPGVGGPGITFSDVEKVLGGQEPTTQPQTNAYRSAPQSRPGLQDQPYVEIAEQPRQRGLRFRYECEGRSAGSIPGENSTNEKRTFPEIKIHNYEGPAVVVVSCVTKDNPPKPHPHSLVGKDCAKGVCTLKVKNRKGQPITFPNLGIQCAKRKEVLDALNVREEIRVDPFQTGFKHKNGAIDLNIVRLCFQVFLPDATGKFTKIVPPVVSQSIFDKKAVNDLIICRLSGNSGTVCGGDEIFLLCDKVQKGTSNDLVIFRMNSFGGSVRGGDEVFLICERVQKEDIQVRFYQQGEHGIEWEGFGDFGQGDVHRQVAIVFKTPPYRDQHIRQPVNVFVQLKRPSDGETSDPKPFQYMPDDRDPECIEGKRKRKKLAYNATYSQGGAMLPEVVESSNVTDMPHVPGSNLTSQDVKERLKAKASRGRMKQERDVAQCMYTQQDQPVPENTTYYASYSHTAMGTMTVASTANRYQATGVVLPTSEPSSMEGIAMPPGAGPFMPQPGSSGPSSLTQMYQQPPQEEPMMQNSLQMDSGTLTNFLQDNLDLGSFNSGDLEKVLNPQMVSFETTEGLSGDLTQVPYDPNVAAHEEIQSDPSEAIQAITNELKQLNNGT